MARHLNLEEQEQLAQIKGFWEQNGRFIILLVTVLVLTIGGWFGWQYWQNKQAMSASVLYDQFQQAVTANNTAKAREVVTQIQTQYGSTSYASLAALQGATAFYNAGELDAAKQALAWLVDNGKEPGWKAIAVLRLADILTDQKNYDEALKVLSVQVPDTFKPMVADKRGNVYVGQGKPDEAKNAYMSAYQDPALPASMRELVYGKLNLLGVDISTLTLNGEQRT